MLCITAVPTEAFEERSEEGGQGKARDLGEALAAFSGACIIVSKSTKHSPGEPGRCQLWGIK